jgi:hypothetical protein
VGVAGTLAKLIEQTDRLIGRCVTVCTSLSYLFVRTVLR